MNASDIVDAFARQAAECLSVLKQDYEGLERATPYTGLTLRPRTGGDPVRSGTLSGVGRFEVHGRGCRFEAEGGGDVDVDWNESGRAVFDSWRLLMFARSIGIDTVDREELRLAATSSPSVSAIADDQFTWPDDAYDITWSDV